MVQTEGGTGREGSEKVKPYNHTPIPGYNAALSLRENSLEGGRGDLEIYSSWKLTLAKTFFFSFIFLKGLFC